MTNVTRFPNGCSTGIRTAKRLPSGAIVMLLTPSPEWFGIATGDHGCGWPGWKTPPSKENEAAMIRKGEKKEVKPAIRSLQ
jgi:hypothetical protein